MRKTTYKVILMAFALTLLFGVAGAGRAWAKDSLFKAEYTVTSKKKASKKFTLKKDQILYLSFDFKLASGKSGGEDGISFTIYDQEDSGQVMSETFHIDKGYRSASYWIYDPEKIDKGSYKLQIRGESKKSVKGTVQVTAYPRFASSMKKLSDIRVTVGKSKTVKLKGVKPSGSLANMEVESEDEKIAQAYADPGESCIYVDGIKKGDTVVTVRLDSGKEYSFKVRVRDAVPELNYKKFTLQAGWTDTIKMENYSGKVKWKSSNKKIATVSKKGIITARRKGKCKITATCDGKKYTATVKVTAALPWYEAKLLKYNTKKNIFTVKIKNLNKKDLIIYPTKAEAVEDNEESLNRDLKLAGGKKVTIRPGKSKTLKFKVIGEKTYKNVRSFYVYYYMKYGKTKYYARTWTDGCAYKKGKKWYPGN